MKYLHVFVLLLFTATGALASDQSAITQQMQDYWLQYSRANFVAAAASMDPRDLKELRDGLLPIFLEAAASANPEHQSMAASFFSQVPAAARKEMTPAEVFAGVNLVIMHAMPDIFEALSETSIEVTEVQVGNEGTATVFYSVHVGGSKGSDSERFSLHEGRWYLRTKEPPAESIAKYRRLLSQ